MVCFHPLKAYYPLNSDSEGKRHLIFGHKKIYNKCVGSYLYIGAEMLKNKSEFKPFTSEYDYPYIFDGYNDVEGLIINIPCGKCLGCKLDYSRMWATRSVNEAIMHNNFNNCKFLTLTFNEDMLRRRENPYSLNKTAFRSFIKRLRKAIYLEYGKTIRYMVCGEYGSKRKRPHYHMLIYGFNFPDSYIWSSKVIHGKRVFYERSNFLEKLWKPAYSDESFGFSVLGSVNFETSAYVSRYITKKLFGDSAKFVYKDKEPEFLLTSRNPGLGYDYLKKYYNIIFNNGYIVLPTGFKAPIPRFYVNKLKDIDEDKYVNYTMSQRELLFYNLSIPNIDNTKERLLIREEIAKNNLLRLYRQYEFDNELIN